VLPDGVLLFDRYIGIDYSGAETPTSSLRGLRVFAADPGTEPPHEVAPPPSARRYWTRRGIAEWLTEILAEDRPTIVGIDHGFSFPIRYFEHHGLELDWPSFLEDFHRHWPTDDDNTYVDFVRDGSHGNGAARAGNARWRRVTELQTRRAKSVFHFDVQGSVAKSTHAGLPWLLHLRRANIGLHFWPFDGWAVPTDRSVIVEVYPALWSRNYPREDRTAHQHDAYAVAAWMRDGDRTGSLRTALAPSLPPDVRSTAAIEGWILGTPVGDEVRAAVAPREPHRALAMVPPKPKVRSDDAAEDFVDCAGKRRRFVLQVYAGGRFLEAREILAGGVPGARMALPVKRGEAPPWGAIRKRIRERLARRDLTRDENGRAILVADALRGQLTWSPEEGLAVIIDDVVLSWDEVGRLLECYEGFDLRLEIHDSVGE
jgi:hypothetical protein